MDIVPQVQVWLQDIREQESARFIADLVGDAATILNVGPSWGRDYYSLAQRHKRVINADIAPQRHLPFFVRCDVINGLPFAHEVFDCVLMPEVLEHLVEDAKALAEAYRVLRNSGRLIVTVPFYNDEPEYHVRIHSPQSIRRLVKATGFEIISYIERGGMISFPRFVHGLRRLCAPFITIEKYNAAIVRIDYWLAIHGHPLIKHSKAYGCYMALRKAKPIDLRQINISEFQH